jgi:hypothetical protein
MPEEIITRDSAAFKELYRDIVKAIRAVDILIDTHRPTIGNELYLTSEEICSIFSISKRSLQNYRDNRQIPYTTLGGKILYPQSSLYKLLEQHGGLYQGRHERLSAGGEHVSYVQFPGRYGRSDDVSENDRSRVALCFR